MTSRSPVRSLLAAALAWWSGLVPGAVPQEAPREALHVVTTLQVLARLTEAVGGERVRVEALADPRQDPHQIEPRPTLMKKARSADAFVEVGLQLELWADKVVAGSGNPRIQRGQPGRIVASTGITTRELPASLSREWGDVHPSGNPHVWLDPLNAIEMARNIEAGLAALDPAGAEVYAAGRARFTEEVVERLFGAALVEEIGAAKLTRLERLGRLGDYLESRDVEAELGGWLARAAPLAGRPLVTYHKTFGYLAERFGFVVPIEIEEHPGIPPSARHRDEVLARMREQDVRVVLQAVYYDHAAADFLTRRTGARLTAVPIDAGEAVGLASYPDLIDRLLEALLAADAAH